MFCTSHEGRSPQMALKVLILVRVDTDLQVETEAQVSGNHGSSLGLVTKLSIRLGKKEDRSDFERDECGSWCQMSG